MTTQTFLLDEENNFATPDTAVWIVVTETDATGKLVSEKWYRAKP